MFVESLVLNRGTVAQGGVASLTVVEDLDVLKNCVGQFHPSLPFPAVQQLDLHPTTSSTQLPSGLTGTTTAGSTSTAETCRPPNSKPSTTIKPRLSNPLRCQTRDSPDMPARFSRVRGSDGVVARAGCGRQLGRGVAALGAVEPGEDAPPVRLVVEALWVGSPIGDITSPWGDASQRIGDTTCHMLTLESFPVNFV